MASNFHDPSLWRLEFAKHTASRNIKFKLVSLELDYDPAKASGTMDIIVATEDIKELIKELLPAPKKVDQIYLPQYRFYSDTPFAIAGMSIRSFDSEFPSDPLGDDLVAPAGTYYPVSAVRLSLEIPPSSQPYEYFPKTYLKISSESSGDFIHSPATDSDIQGTDDRGQPVLPLERARTPLIPYSVLAPQTAWTVKWDSIPLQNYDAVILPRLKYALGKVNKYAFDTLGVTAFNTLLLVSYSQERVYSWQNEIKDIKKSDVNQLVNLSMKFLEKNIKVGTEVHGHQSFWVQGHGWKYLTRDGVPTFETTDFFDIFNHSTNVPPSPP